MFSTYILIFIYKYIIYILKTTLVGQAKAKRPVRKSSLRESLRGKGGEGERGGNGSS